MKSGQETYKLIAEKNKEGIALLYERYGKKLYGYAVHSWKLDEDDAWNIVYKTLYKILDTSADYTFESENKFSSFIFKVFINNLRQHYRETKKAKEKIEIIPGETELHGEAIAEEFPENNSEKMNLLKAELEKLEDWERILLLMRSQDMPYSEIAKYVNKPEGQLKVYYSRLKAALTKRINEKLEE